MGFQFIHYNNHGIPIYSLLIDALFDFGLYFFIGSICYFERNLIVYRKDFFLVALTTTLIILWNQNYELLREVQYLSLPYIVFYLSFQKGKLNYWGKYGDFSYGIYVYGFLVQQCLIQVLGSTISSSMMIVLSFLFVLPLSYFSWHFVESPALKFKQLFNVSYYLDLKEELCK